MSKIKYLALAALLSVPCASHAALINLGPGSFTPQAAVITFSEQALGTINPVYVVPTTNLGAVTVSFEGHFVGQTEGGFPNTLTGTPTGPLTLGGGTTRITTDGANPTSPVLSGDPTFNGPISVLFSTPVAAVGLTGGYFDAIGGTTIEAYGADGTVLGSITNSALGIEFYGLADSSGQNVIAGISFYITGSEPAGFAIDNLTFGSARELVDPPGVPDGGATVVMLGLALSGMGIVRRWQKK